MAVGNCGVQSTEHCQRRQAYAGTRAIREPERVRGDTMKAEKEANKRSRRLSEANVG